MPSPIQYIYDRSSYTGNAVSYGGGYKKRILQNKKYTGNSKKYNFLKKAPIEIARSQKYVLYYAIDLTPQMGNFWGEI